VIRESEARDLLAKDPDAFMAGRELTAAERQAVLDGDTRALYQLGAILFLIYQFVLARAGKFTLELVEEYAANLEGLSPVNLET
jgi:hypothetical protein